ncbi:hypothetical protein O181_059443 [Austropuccinia psidii MF-1]|uniref:Uncharacterized protein n=1 Tax=Austropuccinia psidii MF-1 TaxID=1389203 RepID=A0A9Q3HWI3_9BASI|nr:hypothetical protein [Austropuccinia psidii MF-1]
MVTFSGPISIFSDQGLKIQHPFQRRIIQLISLTSYGGNQKTIQGPQPPGHAGVGLEVQFRIIQKGRFSGVLNHFNKLSRWKVLQHPLDNSIGPYR